VQQIDAANRWASSPEGEKWIEDLAAEMQTDAWREAQARRARIAKTSARRAQRRRGKLKAKPGNYQRSRSSYDWAARDMLPVALRALRAHFRAHNPPVRVTQAWAAELTARCLDYDEVSFCDFVKKGRHRLAAH
jgi:hypothetical protein